MAHRPPPEHESLQAELGQQLRGLRLDQQRTQDQLAGHAGVSLRALQQLENGAGSTLATCLRVLQALGKLSVFDGLAPMTTVNPMAPQRARRTLEPVLTKRTPMPIRIANYPQLRLIAWNRREDATLDDVEALALYERNWRHVEADALEPRERRLIDRLVQTVGNGVLHV